MPRQIRKYKIRWDGIVRAPPMSKILLAEDENGDCYVWLECPSSPAPDIEYRFQVFGTGADVDPEWDHVQSFQRPPYVWHVYRNLFYARPAN